MAITKPPVLPAWAESGDKVTPSNAEIQVGWPLSSIPPSRQRFNWLLNFLANGIRYFSRRGLPDYDAAETYMTGDRIIGDDGKTYRSLIDNNTAQTPSTSPTKWERWGFTFDEFLAGVATPPQFDNDTSLATTAFVQRALGNRQNNTELSSATALTAADAGKWITLSGGTTYTVTLPNTFSVAGGAEFIFHNDGGVSYTVQQYGSDVIAIAGGLFSSVSIGPGEFLAVSAQGSIWRTAGSAVLKNEGQFGSSLAAHGFQRLPSGLIIQWGVVGCPANYVANTRFAFTLPIAFPLAALRIIASNSGLNNTTPGTQADFISGSQAEVVWSESSVIAYGLSASYIAFGY